MIFTAPGGLPEPDAASRRFGLPEGLVTGFAHSAPASWGAPGLARADLPAERAPSRGALVRTTLDQDRPGLAGPAMTVIRGRLIV
ncbi:hypothetical protein F4560_006024 [Saccharothrix ecbatanensis]|uniref:Uncharacterized protein n=1 Tax=Saccharothrix ecbatanensis TaxID=1105145 RepID=A0A7W9HQD6_9PSEU|nr:hypothetical protein [Saccharothrix ecbatanensis]MBB5806256.1 hypothetical protein [Saccharothrix ecbatanensis]